jgi:nitrite reductase (NO-forming)
VVSSDRPLPVLVVPTASGRRAISRTDDRRITFGGLVAAAGLVAFAIASLALPESVRRGLWLPLHLAMAGAASTAIAAVLPFFTAALAVAPPAGRPTRILAIGGIALGALVVSGGVAAGLPAVAVGGGLTYLGGLAAVAAGAFGPLRGALGPRRPLVTRAYGVALGCVAVGVVLSTAFLAGYGPVLERWALLKPAHAWLNVIGFLSVIVAATLVHLAPTVAGGRIQPRTSARVAVVGLAAGAPIVALGLGLALDAVVRGGAIVTAVGAVGLVAHGLVVRRDRGRWTTDPGWHRLTAWSLTVAPGWLAITVGIAGIRFLWLGAEPAAWDLALIAPALALGWLAQVLVGSWSHLVPAIGPGDPMAHARQRAILGTAATARLVALNGGVALATVGLAGDLPQATAAGLALAITAVVAALGTLAVALRPGAGDPTVRP